MRDVSVGSTNSCSARTPWADGPSIDVILFRSGTKGHSSSLRPTKVTTWVRSTKTHPEKSQGA
jgi:hypothetical protein